MTSGKDGGTGKGGVLVTQESMIDANTAKVYVKAKADAPDASNNPDTSKIDTPKIDVRRGIGKPCAIAIALSWRVSLRQQALRDAKYIVRVQTQESVMQKGHKKRGNKILLKTKTWLDIDI